MSFTLPKPPHSSNGVFDSVSWQRWFNDLGRKLREAGAIAWAQVSKVGSNLTDLETRNHADLQNLNTTSYTHLTDAQKQAVLSQLSTALITGCVLSINANNTKFDISSGTLRFVDAYTNPLAPTVSEITYAGSTANTVTNLATQDNTYIYLDSAGVIHQTQTRYTDGDVRDHVFIGGLIHTTRTYISEADPIVEVNGFDIANALGDVGIALGPISQGNVYSGNATTGLAINKSVGTFTRIGINWKNSKKSPNIINSPASSGAPFLATWRDGSGGWHTEVQSTITPGYYDDGTGGTGHPNGVLLNNKWQIIRIWYLPNAYTTVVVYGQAAYTSEAIAEANLATSVETNPALSGALPFRGWILVRGGATDLKNTADAIFLDAGKLGTLMTGSGSGSSTTTLQGSYDNSIQPQIVTSTTGGAVQVKRGTSADTDIVFEVLNGAGTSKFSVKGDGTTTLGTALAIASGGTGQTTAQAAINALTQVSGATNEYVLTKDTATGNAAWKAPGAGSGTVTNTGTLTAHAVILGNGTVDVTALGSLGSAGQVLTSGGAGADPTWTTIAGTGTVTNTGGNLDAYYLMVGNGGADIKKLTGGLGTSGQSLLSNGAGAEPTWGTPSNVSDGDKGDISVASGTWTIDAGVVTHDKLATAYRKLLASTNDFRLTLTTGTPVTTADVTGATTIYCTPYKGNAIALYDGTNWNVRTSAEFSIALGTLTASIGYDVFCYDNAGTPTLELLAWTNATARATALAYQDGVLVKSGAATRRYLGSFYTMSTTTTEDSAQNRMLFNYYHRIVRPSQYLITTASWTYTTATWRQANNSTSNQVTVFNGVDEGAINVTHRIVSANTGTTAYMVSAIGLDSTTAVAALSSVGEAASLVAGRTMQGSSNFVGTVGLGWHKLVMLEYSTATGTTTWYGAGGYNNGIRGTWAC